MDVPPVVDQSHVAEASAAWGLALVLRRIGDQGAPETPWTRSYSAFASSTFFT